MRNLIRLLGITWQDRVTNASVLSQAGMPSMSAILAQGCLRWLGHVCRMEDGHIPTDILYGELTTGKRPTLRYKDVCKKDLKACGFNPAELEAETSDRTRWRSKIKDGVKMVEERRESQWEEKRFRKRQRLQSPSAAATIPTTGYICNKCHRSCGSRIGLHSHRRRCTSSHPSANAIVSRDRRLPTTTVKTSTSPITS